MRLQVTLVPYVSRKIGNSPHLTSACATVQFVHCTLLPQPKLPAQKDHVVTGGGASQTALPIVQFFRGEGKLISCENCVPVLVASRSNVPEPSPLPPHAHVPIYDFLSLLSLNLPRAISLMISVMVSEGRRRDRRGRCPLHPPH